MQLEGSLQEDQTKGNLKENNLFIKIQPNITKQILKTHTLKHTQMTKPI